MSPTKDSTKSAKQLGGNTFKGVQGRGTRRVIEAAPEFSSKTWFGMPAYANQDGKVVRCFRNATKFKERYQTFGFKDRAKFDEGSELPVAYAVTN